MREIDHIAQDFDEVRHVACLHREPPPLSALPYESDRVRLIPVPPSGGQRLREKLGIVGRMPRYTRTIWRELPQTDVVHVRCPANISLIAVVLLALVRYPRRRWVKYAGNWQPYPGEAWSYTFQRWWLRSGLHRGVVTVNGHWPGQPAHVYSFLNPCFTDAELAAAQRLACGKTLAVPGRLLYVGALSVAKGVDKVLQIVARLQQAGLSVRLDVAGDGAERPSLEKLAVDLGVDHLATFHGWLPWPALAPLYAQAHIMILPSRTEGWPKVLSEGMAAGVVPVASSVGSIPQYLQRFGTGKTFDPEDLDGFTNAVRWYLEHPAAWQVESRKAVATASLFTYAKYVADLHVMLGFPAD